MGLLTPFIASTSVGGWIELLILIALLFLNYWATMRIITQAGYSAVWIVLPIAPLVLTIICYVIFWNDIHEIFFGSSFGFGGINNVSIFWHLDEIGIFLNWLFYIVFAFSRWPVSGTRHSPDVDVPQPPPSLGANLSSAAGPASPSPLPGARVMPASRGGPVAGPANVASAPASKPPSAQFCAWCGEALPGNRALFHDCGPKDRPETFCKNCGVAFPAGTSQCNSCVAA
jgi:hypothetical protein